MSLINDALKRAKQAQQNNPPSPGPGPELRPVESRQHRGTGPGMLLPVVSVLVVALATFFLWRAWQKQSPAPQAAKIADASPTPPPGVPAVSVPPAAAGAPQLASGTPPGVSPGPAAGAASAALPQDVAPNGNPASVAAQSAQATSAPGASGEPAAPPSASAKLQGILYRPGRPAAIVDGKTVFVGDAVGEFRVLAIRQSSVTLVGAGQTNVLRLPE